MSDLMQAGLPTRYDRKIGGRGYLVMRHPEEYTEDNEFETGRHLHRSLLCRMVSAPQLVKVPYFYERDGTMKAQVRGTEVSVSPCPTCSGTDSKPLDWHDRAACKDTVLVSWDDPTKFIAVHCDDCPVQRECLDQGEVDSVGGMVYGGIWLGQNPTQRKEQIAERRAQWEQQGSAQRTPNT